MNRSSTRYQAILLVGVLIASLLILRVPLIYAHTPDAPTGLTATVNADKSITLTWNAVPDVEKYRGQWGTDPTFTTKSTFEVNAPTTSFTTPAGLAPGTYYFRVGAGDFSGPGHPPPQWSDWSQPVSATITSSSVDTSLTLSIAPSSVVVGSSGPVTFTATLTRTDTNTGVAGATISFTVDGSTVGSAITNPSGVATFNYNPSALTPGSHTVQASFAGQTIGEITFNPSTSNTQTLQVIYNFIGFLPPLGSGTFKAGRTIPVKFQLTDAKGNYISTATAQIWVDSNSGTSSGSSNNENYFRYDPTNNQYIFDLSTKDLQPGTYTIKVTLDDGTVHAIEIKLK